MASPFSTAFRTYILTFTVAGEDRLIIDPVTGLERPAPGTEQAILEATLRAAGSLEVRAQLGADTQEVALEGRCVRPMTLPAGVVDGLTSPLTYGGTPGVFELRIADPDPIPAVEQALGEKITGVWRAQRS